MLTYFLKLGRKQTEEIAVEYDYCCCLCAIPFSGESIFGTARQRSVARKNQAFKEHVLEQLSEHKQLLISPIVLLTLARPHLILSLVSGCIDSSTNPCLCLFGYFISYIPSMLIFVVFVFPSEVYTKTFKESMTQWLQRFCQ